MQKLCLSKNLVYGGQETKPSKVRASRNKIWTREESTPDVGKTNNMEVKPMKVIIPENDVEKSQSNQNVSREGLPIRVLIGGNGDISCVCLFMHPYVVHAIIAS